MTKWDTLRCGDFKEMKKITFGAVTFAAILLSHPAISQEVLTSQNINEAEFTGALPEAQSALTTKLQVLLDRAGSKPGVIDGKAGDNVIKAIRGYEEIQGLPPTGVLTADLWSKLQSPDPVTKVYVIKDTDVEKLVDTIPDDYLEKSKMAWLGYTSGAEAIAEKFHMDKEFLTALNPGASFSTGDSVLVADPGKPHTRQVTRIIAEKGNKRLVVYADGDRPYLIFPATIGSEATPSPEGTHEVRAIAEFPTYTYNPDVNFKQGENDKVLTIPPGPNGPVGSTWIDLTEPTYGIHGTPEPSQISKTSSHGCIRLTNWGAAELAKLVKPGVKVTFVDSPATLY